MWIVFWLEDNVVPGRLENEFSFPCCGESDDRLPTTTESMVRPRYALRSSARLQTARITSAFQMLPCEFSEQLLVRAGDPSSLASSRPYLK